MANDRTEQAKAWIQLSMVPGLGPIGFWALVDRFGSPAAVLKSRSEDWHQVPSLRSSHFVGLRQASALAGSAESEMTRLAKLGGRVLLFEDHDYPELLRCLTCPPPVLFVLGEKALPGSAAIAVVGSRSATSYGRRVSYRLGRDLGSRGVTVVSGLAQGIDAEAHAGCLDAGGLTVAVLGCGLDVVYPRSNQKLFERICQAGLLISEYPLGTRPEPFRFPARNRIIAGLVRGVVVVEAALKSGSLITVQHALEEGREVFAVPGQVDSIKSSGSHWLLQQGATLAVCADDIIRHAGIPAIPGPTDKSGPGRSPELGGAEASLLASMDAYPVGRDELMRRSRLSAAHLNDLLLRLELAGAITSLPGDRVQRLM